MEEKLTARSCAVPEFFAGFSGYNNPETYKNKRLPLWYDNIHTSSQLLFKVLQQPWLENSSWNTLKVEVEKLTLSFDRYTNYLEDKNAEVQHNRASLEPVRNLGDYIKSVSLKILPFGSPQPITHTQLTDTLYESLMGKEDYGPVFLNQLLPNDHKEMYKFVSELKKLGLPFRSVMYSYTAGNNTGSLFFVWKVCFSDSDNDVSETNSPVVAKLSADMPQYHTREMRRIVAKTVDTIVNVKPMVFRNLYRLLSGDCSASETSDQLVIDQRIQMILETGDLEIQDLRHLNEGRQLRHDHPDVHYCHAMFKYLREMAIMFRNLCVMVCLDDKHKIKLGEPKFLVAACERGRQVLVAGNKLFEVADHDFTKMGIIPSVTLKINVPKSIEESFYTGTVYVNLKDSVFEPSSPLRHAAELHSILKKEIRQPILLLYTDGGPDHRLNYITVQLSYLCIFLQLNLDCLIAVRTAPNSSWINSVERVMSVVNMALQCVGPMREESTENFEILLKGCNSLKKIRACAETNQGLKEAVLLSTTPPRKLLSSLIGKLKWKDEDVQIITSATDEEIIEFFTMVKYLDYKLTPDVKMFEKANHKHKIRKSTGHHIPFSPTAQICKNVGEVLNCTECDKPRVMYSNKKLTQKEKDLIECITKGFSYSCGMVLQEAIDKDELSEGECEVLSKVFVRANLSCNSPIEVPYYSSQLFIDVCTNCAATENLTQARGSVKLYPICEKCFRESTLGIVIRRKRKFEKEKQ
ncbi:uncharacterized protein LOC141898942 [Tubulanus polymorphus]|uniref:uncharacterized protein LOC141898942 n=1 Tax=Tubulanus polymorphus TaxID=672921 RepID=UPI003DA27C45